MQLIYHKGRNFGDALNPILFNHFLPGVFDDQPKVSVLGIGSVLGLYKPVKETEKVLVYSSGFGGGDADTYGRLPENLGIYEFICVRGPKTAKALNIDSSKAVADGALLFPDVVKHLPVPVKQHKVSYMPHWGSFSFFESWNELLNDSGINLIDPRGGNEAEVMHVINQIRSSELVLCEAMHGAILSDAFRVPWVPVKQYPTINAFKWQDFTASLDLTYEPQQIPRLFSNHFYSLMIRSRLKLPLVDKLGAGLAGVVRSVSTEKQVLKRLKEIAGGRNFLSKDEIFTEKTDRLRELMEQLKGRISQLR